MTNSNALQEQIDRYLDQRLEQYASWYDGKAIKLKAYFLRSRIAAAVGAVLVPVLNSLDWTTAIAGYSFDLPSALVTGVGLTVAVLIALEGVLHHREQWKNYRTTEQFLRSQKFLFENRVGEYSTSSDEEAFKLLVINVEGAIKAENEVTLNVLGRADSGETFGSEPGGS